MTATSGLGVFKLFGREFKIMGNRLVGEHGKAFLPTNTRGMTAVATPTDFKPVGKVVNKIAQSLAKGTLLAKTAGFFPAMGITLVAGAGIGYLLGNAFDDDDKNQGLVVEKEKKQEEPKPVVEDNKEQPKEPKPVVEVTENTEKDYHTIKTGGMSWAGIVQSYYPELVEKCDGKLYGKDGAIRKLKEALSKCDDIDLVNASDIPKTLNLPLELEGVKINQNASVQNTKIAQTGGHTDIQESGCKNTKTTYTATDKQNQKSFTWHDEKAVVDSLKVRTGVEEYEVRKAS